MEKDRYDLQWGPEATAASVLAANGKFGRHQGREWAPAKLQLDASAQLLDVLLRFELFLEDATETGAHTPLTIQGLVQVWLLALH